MSRTDLGPALSESTTHDPERRPPPSSPDPSPRATVSTDDPGPRDNLDNLGTTEDVDDEENLAAARAPPPPPSELPAETVTFSSVLHSLHDMHCPDHCMAVSPQDEHL